MVEPIKPVSLVMEGYFEGNLLERLRKYDEGFKPMPGKEDREKYGLYVPEVPSLIIASKLLRGRVLPPNGTNILAAFSSYSDERNLKMLRDFEEKTGIRVPHRHQNLLLVERVMPLIVGGSC